MNNALSNFVRKFPPKNHWFILAISILVAVFIWASWSSYGVKYMHRQLVSGLSELTKVPSTASNGSSVLTEQSSVLSISQALTEYGQAGDSFGGLNALLTALAGAFVFWAGFMQHQALKEAGLEAERERSYRHKQEFEALLFQLMALSSSAVDRVERKKVGNSVSIEAEMRRGSRALDSYAASLYKAVDPGQIGITPERVLQKLVTNFFTMVYDRNPSVFGPYYRMLLQIFQHIADSGLSEEEQHRYASIARGQVSEGAVLLLALYGLSSDGRRFHPLIEKFSLLTYMHRRHLKVYYTALLIAYRPRAFKGENAAESGRRIETPLLPQSYFDSIEDDRERADEVSDFDNGYDSDAPTDE